MMDIKKISIVGDKNVGKTTLVRWLTTNTFDEEYHPTLGVEVRNFPTKDLNGEAISLQFWDVSGDCKFDGIRDGYHIGSETALIFVSCEDENPLVGINRWMKELEKNSISILPIFFFTKCDLITVENLEKYTERKEEILSVYQDFSTMDISLKNSKWHTPMEVVASIINRISG